MVLKTASEAYRQFEEDKLPPLAPLPCGLVLFDHIDDLTAGSAFLPNSPIQRVRSLNDLRNDVVWVSNLSVFEQRIRNHPVVRSGYYFKTLLSEIAQDIGIQSSQDGQMQPDDALRVAELLTRTLTIAANAYDWNTAESGASILQESLFLSDVKKGLPRAPTPDARFNERLTRALTQAYQEQSEPSWVNRSRYESNSIYLTLRFNPVNYFHQLLENPVPAGKEWVSIDESALSVIKDPVAFCCDRPSLAKATIEWANSSSDLAALAAYGQAGRRKNTMRLWLTQPELVWLSKIAKVTISAIFYDKSGFTSLPRGAKLPTLLTHHPEACLSYSAGLVASNHYHAISSMSWDRRNRTEKADVWSAWIKAIDRGFMFSMALKAHEAGFHVAQYGNGSLRLRVNRNNLDELIEFKESHGFMYPDLSLIIEEQPGV